MQHVYAACVCCSRSVCMQQRRGEQSMLRYFCLLVHLLTCSLARLLTCLLACLLACSLARLMTSLACEMDHTISLARSLAC